MHWQTVALEWQYVKMSVSKCLKYSVITLTPTLVMYTVTKKLDEKRKLKKLFLFYVIIDFHANRRNGHTDISALPH